MQILGHGVDVVDLTFVELRLKKDAESFTGWFNKSELDVLGERAFCVETVAGRMAAKEAVAKSLGTGFSDRVSWQDIEIGSNEAGAPQVLLQDGAADVARESGVTRVLLSISHSRTVAIGSAISIRD